MEELIRRRSDREKVSGRFLQIQEILPDTFSLFDTFADFHLRCVTTAAQKVLLNRLGLTLPQRLRRTDETDEIDEIDSM